MSEFPTSLAKVEEVFLEHATFGVQRAMSVHELEHLWYKVQEVASDTGSYLVLELKAMLAQERWPVVTWERPMTWWDAVKERWAPAWFRRRWPVQKETLCVDGAAVYWQWKQKLRPEELGTPYCYLVERPGQRTEKV